jgi:hypothetical protein
MVMPRVLSCIRRACEYLLFPGGKVAEAFSAGFGFAGTILRAQFSGGERGLWIANCGAWRPESGIVRWLSVETPGIVQLKTPP